MKDMRELLRLQDRLAASDITELIQDYARGAFTPREAEGLETLFAALAERDPESAWQLATTLPKKMQPTALQATMVALAEKSSDAALAKLDDIKDAAVYHSLRRTVIDVVAKDDPSRAFALLGKPQQDDYSLVSDIFDRWGRDDMQTARNALVQMDKYSRVMAAEALASVMAETDSAAAWKFATENIVPTTNVYEFTMLTNTTVSNILRQWMHTDPKAALEAAASVENDMARNFYMADALRTWVEIDSDAAVRFIKGSTDSNIIASGFALIADKPGVDRAALLAMFFEHVPANIQRSPDVRDFLSKWAADNPREAAAAIETLPRHLLRYGFQIIPEIAAQWFASATDKNEPLRWATSLTSESARNEAVQSIFTEWSKTDPAAAVAAATRLSDESRSAVMSAVLASWSKTDSQAALQWAASLPDDSQRRRVIYNAVDSIALNNPQQAIALLNACGMGDDTNIVGQVVRNWARRDIEAASSWVQSLPQGNVRNEALYSMAFQLAYNENSHETALAWILAIDDKKMREQNISSIVSVWKSNSAPAAKAWVEAANISEELKEKLLK